jgi:hypothetical protein
MNTFKYIAAICFASILASAANADEITHWSAVVQQAIRVNGGGPCPIGRAVAMTHVAMYEAYNSIKRTHTPYIAHVECPANSNVQAAIAVACHDVLVEVYPAQAPVFDGELAARLALIPPGQPKTDGMTAGHLAAEQCIVSRLNDGSDNNTPYDFGDNPGDYRISEDLPPGTLPHAPNWGLTVPFAMTHQTQFRHAGPGGITNMSTLLSSALYAANLNEVKSIGARNSSTRTSEQTEIAFFWANDVDGTYKPPGHLLSITTEISVQQGLSLEQNARLFALVGLAMGDAGVCAWDMKYQTDIDLWRPITGIRNAHLDSNPLTDRDPNWLPLNPFSPPFPAWTSGHSTFGGAHAGVMAEFFGTDEMDFTITSEDPFYAALPGNPGPRSFHRFSDAAVENSLSRIYLGVHWRFDCQEGVSSGLKLGRYIGATFFHKVFLADFNGDGQLNLADVIAFRIAYQAGDPSADFNRDGDVNFIDWMQFMFAYFGRT